MTGNLNLKNRLKLLDEIAKIMESVKTIAMIEAQQTRAMLPSQRLGLEQLRRDAIDFRQSFSLPRPKPSEHPQLLIVIGSERGFCHDFNARLVDFIEFNTRGKKLENCRVIPIGYHLWRKMKDDPRVIKPIVGASVAGELESTLEQLLECCAGLEDAVNYNTVSLLYLDERTKEVCLEPLLDPLPSAAIGQVKPITPILNLPPEHFFAEFIGHYVLSRLNYIITLSFVTENEQRMQHLENALDQIETQRLDLSKQQNHLRQEQITEELEIIMLNSL